MLKLPEKQAEGTATVEYQLRFAMGETNKYLLCLVIILLGLFVTAVQITLIQD